MTIFYTIFLSLFILCTLPLQVLISLLIFISSGSPILFKQKRVGEHGKIFTLIKFRTMVQNAEVVRTKLLHKNEAKGPVFKIHQDPRFTRIGRFLSHTGLDELPQLFNIIKGDMAILGPRPLPVAEAKKLLPWQQARHNTKPGIISPWIVNGYHSNSFEEWMRSDIVYAQQKSIIGDIFLLLRAGLFFIELLVKELRSKF